MEVDSACISRILCEQLERVIVLDDSRYNKDCKHLLRLLLQLHKKLLHLEARGRDVTDVETEFLERARTSLSKSYALVEMVAARVEDPPSVVRKISDHLFKDDLTTLCEVQLAETKKLLCELPDDKGDVVEDDAASTAKGFAVTKLDVCMEGLDEKLLVKGEFIPIPVTGSDNRLMYTAQLWLNHPKPLVLRRMARTMSARLECKYQLDPNTVPNRFPDIFDISVHNTNKKGKLFPKECAASISLEDVLQAQVKSFRSDSIFPMKPGRVLQRGHVWGLCRASSQGGPHLLCEGYKAHISFNNAALQGLGVPDTQTLCIQGIKQHKQVYYKCFVQTSGEVLAIYRHKKKSEHGTLHLLGIGNHPDVRDIIFASFIALGLTSKL